MSVASAGRTEAKDVDGHAVDADRDVQALKNDAEEAQELSSVARRGRLDGVTALDWACAAGRARGGRSGCRSK